MALVVFVLVEGALIWIVVRDRKRSDDNSLPKQIHGNMKVEVIWTIIPIFLVLALFVMTVQTVNALVIPKDLIR